MDFGAGDVGGAEEFFPVFGAEAAQDGDGAIVFDEAMPAGERGHQFEAVVGDGHAVEVVDEPAEACDALHPGEEIDDLGGFEVVHEQRVDDEVDAGRRLEVEGVAGEEGDGTGDGGFARGANGVGVEVDAGKDDGERVIRGPLVHATEHVAVAAADIDDVNGAILQGKTSVEEVEPAQGGVVGAGEAINAGDVAEAAAQVLVGAWKVHEFGVACEIGALAEV